MGNQKKGSSSRNGGFLVRESRPYLSKYGRSNRRRSSGQEEELLYTERDLCKTREISNSEIRAKS